MDGQDGQDHPVVRGTGKYAAIKGHIHLEVFLSCAIA